MRGLASLVLVGWFAAGVPCAALAGCNGAPARSACCGGPASCCCHGAGRGDPRPAPAVPSPRVAPDHGAELPAAAWAPAGAVAVAACASELAAPPAEPAPVYLSGCSFRC